MADSVATFVGDPHAIQRSKPQMAKQLEKFIDSKEYTTCLAELTTAIESDLSQKGGDTTQHKYQKYRDLLSPFFSPPFIPALLRFVLAANCGAEDTFRLFKPKDIDSGYV